MIHFLLGLTPPGTVLACPVNRPHGAQQENTLAFYVGLVFSEDYQGNISSPFAAYKRYMEKQESGIDGALWVYEFECDSDPEAQFKAFLFEDEWVKHTIVCFLFRMHEMIYHSKQSE